MNILLFRKYVVIPLRWLTLYFLPSWRASYQPHLEERSPIWGDDWLHSPFIGRSPSWGFLGLFLAIRQMPGDLSTARRTISLSPWSLATYVTDATLGASALWLGTQTGAGGTATLTKIFFGRRPWLHGQQVLIVFSFINYFSLFPNHNQLENIKNKIIKVKMITYSKITNCML